MQRRFENVKRIGRRIGLTAENSYLLAIFLALLIVSLVIGGYYVILRPQPEPYSTIYLLDLQRQASDYPQVLVENLNSTFRVYTCVENHLGGTQNQTYQVQVKITQDLSVFPVTGQPVNVYDLSLADGNTWSELVTITQNDVGSYWVVFELYKIVDGALVFTHNYCVLSIQVIG